MNSQLRNAFYQVLKGCGWRTRLELNSTRSLNMTVVASTNKHVNITERAIRYQNETSEENAHVL